VPGSPEAFSMAMALKVMSMPDALDAVGAGHLDLLGDGPASSVSLMRRARPGLLKEGLLVAEHDRLVAHLELALTGAQLDQADGRGSGGREGLLGLFRNVRTGIQVDLFGRQFHGEGQAGWKAAVLAVGFGQQLVDLKT
jgi:hypothetical protein